MIDVQIARECSKKKKNRVKKSEKKEVKEKEGSGGMVGGE